MSYTLQKGCCTLLALGFLAGCGKEPVSPSSSAPSAMVAGANGASFSRAGDAHRQVALQDDCDPRDTGWAPTGGCLRAHGDVNLAEFGAFLTAPRIDVASGLVGHPAWQISPAYMKIEAGKSFLVTNEGGRLHTFTEVATFGGGRVPPLNVGFRAAPACLLAAGAIDPTAVAPGASLRVNGLSVGEHEFQCCIHPWMRQVVKVQAGGADRDS